MNLIEIRMGRPLYLFPIERSLELSSRMLNLNFGKWTLDKGCGRVHGGLLPVEPSCATSKIWSGGLVMRTFGSSPLYFLRSS